MDKQFLGSLLRIFCSLTKPVDASFGDFSEGNTSLTGDTSTSIDLQAGQFAYFSAGPDKQANNNLRADILGVQGNDGEDATDEVNKDNIVEIGP